MTTSALTLQDVFASAEHDDHKANPEDEDLASGVVAALREFERAVNEAVKAGIEVEPRFERVRSRLPGVAVSYVARVEMSRKVG